MQEKFDSAHKTLDQAESMLKPEYKLAQVRITLERGRVFHQSSNIELALKFFHDAYELSVDYGYDFQTVNAAHMIAIVSNDVMNKIKWNKIA